MNRVYQFAMRLQDLVSPTLMRISQQYSGTVSKMTQMTSKFKSMFSGATQSAEELRRKLEGLKGRRDLLIDTRQIKAANREIDGLQRKIDKLQGKGSGSATGAGGMMAGLARQALPYLGAAGLIAGAASLAQSGIGREQTQIAYEQFTRDPAAAQKLIAAQNRFADVTPFTNDEVMGAGRSMLSYGFKAPDIVRQETMVGNVAAGVQTNFGELAGVYGKLKSKGFADTGDLWQFADRGIPILDALSKSLHKSKEEVLKMAETRQIKFTDIENAFESMTSKGGMFEGMLDKMSKTTGGKLSTFVGTVQNKFATLAESLNPLISMLLDVGNGLFSALDPVFVALMGLFKAFEPLFNAIGTLLKLFGLGGEQAGVLTIIIQTLAGAINGVAWVVNLLASAIQYLVDNPILLFLTSAGLIILNLGTIVGWMMSLVLWVGEGIVSIILFATAWWEANAAMLACPATWIVAAIIAISAAVLYAWDHIDGFRHAVIRCWEVIKSMFSSVGPILKALVMPTPENIAAAYSAVKSSFAAGIAAGDTAVSASDKARKAAGNTPKVPTAPTLNKPTMPGAPGGKGKEGGVGKAAGLDATTGGTKSTTITINLKSLVERLEIKAGTVGEGVKDMEALVEDALLRVLNSANSMQTQ